MYILADPAVEIFLRIYFQHQIFGWQKDRDKIFLDSGKRVQSRWSESVGRGNEMVICKKSATPLVNGASGENAGANIWAAGLEPAWCYPTDFKSVASADSATPRCRAV